MDTIDNDKGCFYRALNDEPVFVLLARDPCAPEAIRHWVTLRQALIGRGEKPLEDHAMLGEALTTAEAAVVWRGDATDPAKWGPGTKRWQIEEVPARVLIEASELELLREIQAEAEISTMPTSADMQPTGGHQLPYEEWVRVRQSPHTMKLGNRFLVWDHGGELVFSENENYRAPGRTEKWTGYYPLRNSLQRDMLWLAYEDHVNAVVHKVETIKRLLPDASPELLTSVAARLRDLRIEYEGVVNSTTWPKTRKDQMLGFGARIERAAREIERSRSAMVATDTPAAAIAAIGEATGTVFDPETQTMRAPSDTLDVTDTPDMPPHRFTMFTKSKGWAYGRGLEINPSHIPDMLDRMADDGWTLHCVLGGVTADKVGMIFRRSTPTGIPDVHYLGTYDGHAFWVDRNMPQTTRHRIAETLAGPGGTRPVRPTPMTAEFRESMGDMADRN